MVIVLTYLYYFSITHLRVAAKQPDCFALILLRVAAKQPDCFALILFKNIII